MRGRKGHRVVTPHGTLFTDQVEPVFNTVPGVARTALTTSEGASQSQAAAGELSRAAKDLQALVAQFQIGGHGPTTAPGRKATPTAQPATPAAR